MHFQIGPFQTSKAGRAKVKVKARLNLHGIVSVESATVSHGSLFLTLLSMFAFNLL